MYYEKLSLKHSCEKLHSHYNDLESEIPATDYGESKMHCAAFRMGGYRGIKYISQCVVHLVLSVRVHKTTYKNVN